MLISYIEIDVKIIFFLVLCLYIADDTSCCIRRIDARDGHAVCEWTTVGKPTGLSVTDGRVLVTCRDQGQLRLFTSDGELLQQVQLEAEVARPSHAVELASYRYDGEKDKLLLSVPCTVLALSAKTLSVSAPLVWNSLLY